MANQELAIDIPLVNQEETHKTQRRSNRRFLPAVAMAVTLALIPKATAVPSHDVQPDTYNPQLRNSVSFAYKEPISDQLDKVYPLYSRKYDVKIFTQNQDIEVGTDELPTLATNAENPDIHYLVTRQSTCDAPDSITFQTGCGSKNFEAERDTKIAYVKITDSNNVLTYALFKCTNRHPQPTDQKDRFNICPSQAKS